MTRWLQAAQEAGWPVTKPTELTEPPSRAPTLEVLLEKSVLSGGGRPVSPPGPALEPAPGAPADALHPDAGALAVLLRLRGPMTYGAAASALGWGVTRAWQAEARLRAAGMVRFDGLGRAGLAGS